MANRPDDFESSSYDKDRRISDQNMAQVREHLDHQLKPAAQWFKHIDHIFIEVDDTVSALLRSEKDRINQTLYKQLSRLAIEVPPPNEPGAGQFSHTMEQFQDLVATAREELCSLKSKLQTDSRAPNSKSFPQA